MPKYTQQDITNTIISNTNITRYPYMGIYKFVPGNTDQQTLILNNFKICLACDSSSPHYFDHHVSERDVPDTLPNDMKRARVSMNHTYQYGDWIMFKNLVTASNFKLFSSATWTSFSI